MAQTRKQADFKRIIVCCDGTWLASDDGKGSVLSNVAKIAQAIAPTGLAKDEETGEERLVKQVVFYLSGLGSGDLPGQKMLYGGLGWGLDTDVTQAYDFISNNYEDGDELFFFGFSRGAFTVRSVAGLVSNIGVLSAVNMKHFDEMWAEFRKTENDQDFRKSAWYLKNRDDLKLRDVQTKVVGVWDTVGALGVPRWGWVNWLAERGLHVNREYAFHNTKVSKRIDYAFQALALDERRLTFVPTLWHEVDDGPAKDLQQVWFPGVHQNIGGQAEEGGDGEQIGDNTFAWMVDNLSKIITFEESTIDELIKHHRDALINIKINNGWGCGNIVDNYAGIVGRFFKLLGTEVRTPGGYPQDEFGTQGATNEFIHPMARVRRGKVPGWKPPALQGYEPQEPNEKGGGWQWTKRGQQPVPEYVMRSEKTMYVVSGGPKDFQFVEKKSLARQLCPIEILQELDDVNRDHGGLGL